MNKNVADWCQERGLSGEDLTARSGLDDSRVRAIVEGRWTPSPAERKSIAAALGVSIEDVAWGHKTPIQHLYGHGPD